MRQARPSEQGFSLIELIMVLFVIAVVLSLMIPSIMNAREAAHRSQCMNNLKQLGLGLQNYEVTHGCLPPGSINPTRPVRNEPEGYHASWVLQLLPFLEQGYMYGVIDLQESVYDAANATVRNTRITTLLCPDEPSLKAPSVWGASSYAANHHDVESPIDVDNHGVMFLNSSIRLDDLLDGASNTILVGEKRIGWSAVDLGWASGTRATLRNTGWAINATPADFPADDRNAADLDATAPRVGGFGSHHRAGGAHFSFGDGSVRWISQTIDARMFQHLGHRADGEVVDHSEF